MKHHKDKMIDDLVENLRIADNELDVLLATRNLKRALTFAFVVVASCVSLLSFFEHVNDMARCEESKHKTQDYKLVNNVVYCRSSLTSFQKLKGE